MRRQGPVDLHIPHVLVGCPERDLIFLIDAEQPVEVERIIAGDTVFSDIVQALYHPLCHEYRIVDDDLVAGSGFLPQSQADEPVDLFEVRRRFPGPGHDHGKGHVQVGRIQQYAQKVEHFFRSTHAAGKNDDAVTQPDKGLKPLFDVGHYNQFADNGVG